MVVIVAILAIPSGGKDADKQATPPISTTQTGQSQQVTQESEAPVETAPEPEAESEPATPVWTTTQKNVMAKAKAYLDYTSFSYSGLVNQLEYEKFSHEDAVWAADNCGADWNEESLKKAMSYIDYSGFSYSGLVKQLEYEGFTSEQAAYGADNCSADWNAEAAEKAKSYLSYSSFSRDGLIEQLEYEGFTHEQAVYGVEQNGF